MGGKKPDTSAQEAQLKRQREQAEAEKEQLARERNEDFQGQTKRRRGRLSLINDLGGLGKRSGLGGK